MSESATEAGGPVIAILLCRLGKSTLAWTMESTEWVEQLRRCVEERGDESHGMTLDELIPEVIDEWTRLREDTLRQVDE